MSTTIRDGLIKLAKRVGKWLLEKLAKLLAHLFRGYVAGKIDDFKRRKKNTRTARKRARLDGKIRRWTAILRWMDEHIDDVAACTGEQFDELAKAAELRRVPMVARCERLAA